MEPTDQVTTDFSAWAAYILGYNPAHIEVWENRIDGINDDGPAVFEDRWSDLYPLSKDPPEEYFNELDDALLELVIHERIRPDVLVELHRIWDAVRQSCRALAECMCRDRMPATWPYNLLWRDWHKLTLHALNSDTVAKWFRLGAQMGELLLERVGNSDLRAKLPDLPDFGVLSADERLTKQVSLLSRRHAEYKQLSERDASLEGSTDIEEQSDIQEDLRDIETSYLLSWLTLHGNIVESLIGEQEQEQPLLIIDEPRKLIRLLGQEFQFAHFKAPKAKGGLRCFLVLAETPNKPLKASKVVSQARLRARKEALPAYLSAFRAVVKNAVRAYRGDLDPTDDRNAKSAFVVPVYGEMMYKLALDPSQVRHIR